MKTYTKTMIDRARFSCLLWHPARKQSRSILTTPEPTRGWHNV